MGKFVKGDVVVVPFPFSDLTANKKRPALVVASLTGDDAILCQITSKTIGDSYAVPLSGSVPVTGQGRFSDINKVRSGLSSMPKAFGGPLRWTTDPAIAAIRTVFCMGELARKRV